MTDEPSPPDNEDEKVVAQVEAETGKLMVDYEPMGILFGENEASRLYQTVQNEVIPGDDYSAHDFTLAAAFFVINHGLIEDRTAEILQLEHGGDRQNAGHTNNIEQLHQNGIITEEFREKMEEAYEDRKATHHGFREMIDQLLEDDFEQKVDRTNEVRIKLRDLVIERGT